MGIAGGLARRPMSATKAATGGLIGATLAHVWGQST
jgi:hypothetical protein